MVTVRRPQVYGDTLGQTRPLSLLLKLPVLHRISLNTLAKMVFAPFADAWHEVVKLKPGFLSTTPHFNFITVHCEYWRARWRLLC